MAQKGGNVKIEIIPKPDCMGSYTGNILYTTYRRFVRIFNCLKSLFIAQEKER